MFVPSKYQSFFFLCGRKWVYSTVVAVIEHRVGNDMKIDYDKTLQLNYRPFSLYLFTENRIDVLRQNYEILNGLTSTIQEKSGILYAFTEPDLLDIRT